MRARIGLLLVLMGCMAAELVHAEPPWWARRFDDSVLGDLRTVTVQIRGTRAQWRHYGFSESAVVNEITSRLASAGLRVMGPAESSSSPDTGIVEVDVHVNDTPFFQSFMVFLNLKKKVPLPQNQEGFIVRTVWSDWRIGSFESDRFEKLRVPIFSLLDQFVMGYRINTHR